MWLFLATEVLFFGGLFVFYAVTRANHPEVFEYGSQFLDVGWGMINTCVLIISSFFVAMAVWAAQCNRKRELIIFLTLTLICAVDFLGIKYVEYSHKFHDHIFWGAAYIDARENRTTTAGESDATAPSEDTVVLEPGDAQAGRLLFRTTCAGCHGPTGAGLPNSGKPLTTSEFISGRNDADLLAFLKKGRMPNDPENTTRILMPPRGGNMMLGDQELMDIIAHLRVLQERAAEAGAVAASPPRSAARETETEVEEAFFIPKSAVPAGGGGSAGSQARVSLSESTGPRASDLGAEGRASLLQRVLRPDGTARRSRGGGNGRDQLAAPARDARSVLRRVLHADRSRARCTGISWT